MTSDTNQSASNAASDPLWPVVKPRSADAGAIEEMNAKMLAFHPALEDTRRADHTVAHYAKAVMERDTSIAELFRQIITNSY